MENNKYKLIESIVKSDLTEDVKQSLIAEINNNNKKGFLDKIFKIVSTARAIDFILEFFKDT